MGRAMKPLQDLMAKTRQGAHRLSRHGHLLLHQGHPQLRDARQPEHPHGEIYTSPVKDSVNGHITYNCPSPYDGFLFRDVYLEFQDGKIVKATSNNTDYMNEILDIDEGARYIGEFAFGVNPEITPPHRDILFDEKIAGSFHLTPGNSYDNASNGNHLRRPLGPDPDPDAGVRRGRDLVRRRANRYTYRTASSCWMN